jgi:hypothetical protein
MLHPSDPIAPQDDDGNTQLHWAAQTFVPRLLGQEKFIFDELVSYVWTHTLVPKVAAARARPPIGPAVNRRGAHEAALRKWLEAFEAANAQLRGLGRDGHVNLLRQQVRGAGRRWWVRFGLLFLESPWESGADGDETNSTIESKPPGAP